MQDLDNKAVNGNLSNLEWNGRAGEVEQTVEAWATLTGVAGDDQLGQAISAYAAAGQFYTCTGPADVYVATVLTGIQAPPAYVIGMTVRMRPSAANTGASTINVATLGVKNIIREDGTILTANQIDTDRDATLVYDGTDFLLSNWSAISAADTIITPAGHLSGCVTSRVDDDTFQVTAGSVRNLADDTTLILGSTFTKNIDASGFVAGSGNNGRPTGVSLTANTPYHMFIIRKTSTGAVDIGIDTSLVATNLLSDSGFDTFRRVGTFRLDGTSDIINYKQNGDYFARYSDFAGVQFTGTTGTFDDDDLFIPNDVRVIVNITMHYSTSSINSFGWLIPGDAPARTASTTSHNFGGATLDSDTHHLTVMSSPIGEIDFDLTISADGPSSMNTQGYWDRRGKDGQEPTV